MGGTEVTKTNNYVPIPTGEPATEINYPMISATAIDDLAVVDSSSFEKKKKRCGFYFCCSNVEFDTEEDGAKALSFLENEKSKSCMMICCSNLEVGSKKVDGQQGKTAFQWSASFLFEVIIRVCVLAFEVWYCKITCFPKK